MLSLDTFILLSLALVVTAWILPGLTVTSIFGPTLAVITLALLNNYLWSTALFFQIPDTLTWQTAMTFLANGVLFWIIVKLLPGIEIKGFLPALVAPVLLTGLSVLAFRYGREIDWLELGRTGFAQIQEIRNQLLASSNEAPLITETR